MYCRNCGKELRPGARFCGVCGSAVEAPHDTHDTAPDEAPVAAARRSDPVRPTPAAQPRRGLPVPPLALVAAVLVVAAVLGIRFIGASSADSGSSSTGASPQTSPAASDEPPVAVDEDGTEIAALERVQLIQASDVAKTEPPQPAAPVYTVEPGLANVINTDIFYLTDDQKNLLERYGFVVDTSWGSDEFFEVYERNRYDYKANFVTCDSLMHTYHLYFQHLQKNIEREHLSAELAQMAEELLSAAAIQHTQCLGTEWEAAAERTEAFFAVGAALADPKAQIPENVLNIANNELDAIRAAQGIGTSAITGDTEDYSQYQVRGYYAGDETLERYFRAMMWFGRINFTQKDESLDRSAALITLALAGEPLKRWETIYAVTSFFAGASDDCGYYEYKPLVDGAFGENATVEDLVGNKEGWERFHALTAAMPAPQINSVPLGPGDDPQGNREEDEKGFRLMGQRFTLDEAIFTRLTFPNLKKDASGNGRMLPTALDVPAALGSDTALELAKEAGASAYADYEDSVKELRAVLTDEGDARWSASLYSQWLYTLNPLLTPKGEGYPLFMQSDQWTRKNLQSYLGSFTELKHDTLLYAKQIMAEMGGMLPDEPDDRGYVEPEPAVFERLASLTKATVQGLDSFGLLDAEDAQNLGLLEDLANRLAAIARKELAGELPSDEEFELIRSYGGQLEHFWQEVYKDGAASEHFDTSEFPCAIVADVATDADAGTVLELGTGRAMPIYVVVPVDGVLRIASGSVFSYYEFEQPMSERLTDSTWRQMMGIEADNNGSYAQTPALEPESWTDDFSTRRTW